MSKYKIREIDRNNEWDYDLWKKGLNFFEGATIFHDPDFLSYHHNKFEEHHLGIFKGEELFGLLPLAILKENGSKIAKSPYGASYGGFIFKFLISYSDSKEIIYIFLNYLKKLNINKVIIIPSLSIYHNSRYSDTFSFALLENKFKVINSDISSVVSLNSKNIESEVFTANIRNIARKARKLRVKIEYKCSINDFWSLMDKTFKKHGVNPTHTKEQYQYLMKMFPNKVYCNIAYLDDIPVAGIGIFEINVKNIMSFYLCSDNAYQQTQAMSLLIYETILNAKEKNFSFFDFGTSSVDMIGRENIFRFKESFGAIGVFRNTYQKELKYER